MDERMDERRDERKDWSERLAKSPAEMTKEELAVWAMREHFALEMKLAEQARLISDLRDRVVRLHRLTRPLAPHEKRERNLAIAAAIAGGAASVRGLSETHGVSQDRIRSIAREYAVDVAGAS